jgi:hypothetical protein
VAALCLVPLLAGGRSPTRAPLPATAAQQTIASPRPALAFEPDAGRYGGGLRFLARRGGYALGLMSDGSTVLSAGRARVRTTLLGARPHPPLRAESLLPGKVNWYVGDDRSRWRNGLPTFAAVRYEQVYPGIDLLFHGRQGRLEYDWVVAPGANPARIAMAFSGGAAPRLTPRGDLVIRTKGGPLRQRRPVAYQQIGGRRVPVGAGFRLDGRRAGLSVGAYDRSRPLVIDPQLMFTTYLGGTLADQATSATVMQTNGSRYLMVGGTTMSPNFHGSNQNADSAQISTDAFISKLSADGSTVIATTFIGGKHHDALSGNDAVTGITNGAGHVYVTGQTNSDDMPTSVSLVTPFDATYDVGDAWIGRLDPTDLSPEIVTYFAGSSLAGIAFTSFSVIVAGSESTTGLATAGAYDETPTNTDAYAASFNANLTGRNWATYLGGDLDDVANGVAVDFDSNVYLAGYTAGSSNFPAVIPPAAPTTAAAQLTDAFIAKLSPDGKTLPFSRLYGGTGYEVAEDVWANGSTAVIGGWSDSDTLPGIGPSSPAPGIDGWVQSLSTTGAGNFGGAWLGGTGTDEEVSAIALDPFGGPIYVTGVTDSTNFPTVNAIQPANAGGRDAFVARLYSNLGSLAIGSSTYLGGSASDSATDITVDTANASIAYVVGSTGSTNFGASATYSPSATDPAQPANAGGGDGFVARIQPLSAQITSGPAEGSTVASPTANFTLAPTSEAGGTFVCKLDNASSYSACTSTPSYPGLPEGAHTFMARYNEPGGGSDGTVAVRHWTVDTQAPAPFALQAPADGAVVGSSPEFSWDATSDSPPSAISYELWVDGSKRDESPSCSNGDCSVTLASALANGPHTWKIRALDAVRNPRESATRSVTVDAAGPSAPGLTAPAADAQIATATPTLTWSAAADDGSGVAAYDVELDGRVLGLGLSSSTLSYTPAALAEGTHDWRVIATDQFGNSTSSATGRFRVDLTPPSAQLTASPNPILAGRTVTLDASASNDPAGGKIVHFEWDLDGDGTFETDGGTTPTITKTFNASGTHLLAVRVTDPVGQSRVAATTLIVTTPPVPVGQLGVTIDNGAQYTRTPDVTLNLKFPTATTQLLVSNDGGFLAPTTFAPKQEIEWKLDSSGPERLPKTVYVRFLLSGIVSETYTDDIILDETPPVVEQAAVAPAASQAARAAKLRSFAVKVKATDSNSGVDALQITAKKSKPGRFLEYRTKLKVKAPTRKLYVRARDRAGNLSAWKKAR